MCSTHGAALGALADGADREGRKAAGLHLLRSAVRIRRSRQPHPRTEQAHLRHPQPLSVQQRPPDGGARAAHRRSRRALAGGERGACGDAARRRAPARPRLPGAGLQHRHEPRARGGSGHRRSHPLARRAPLERRHQLHARAGRHQGDDQASASRLGPASPFIRYRVQIMVRERVRAIVAAAVGKVLPEAAQADFQIEPPKQAEHGDFAVNAALVFAKIAKTNPRKLAQAIIEKIEDPDRLIEKIEIAGPGFLNLHLARDVWHRELKLVWEERELFGRSNAGKGLRTMVEFVSANPTGPMHVGHGRGAVIGDVVANLLEWAGYQVGREFYVNDAGGQVWRLAHAVLARATELRPGVPRVELDAEDYQGEYVREVAQAWLDAGGDPTRPFAEIRDPLRPFPTASILATLTQPLPQFFGTPSPPFSPQNSPHPPHPH